MQHMQRGVEVCSITGLENNDVSAWGSECLVQKFIENPLLILDCKFTFRCYVIVRRADREFFLHKKGKLYHCLEPFETGGRAAWITSGYIEDALIRDFPYTFEQLQARFAWFAKVWDNIVECMKSFHKAVEPYLPPNPEELQNREGVLLGIDVEVDADLVPWILETNIGPDMSFKNDVDTVLKEEVCKDFLALLDFAPCENVVRI